MAIGVTPIPGYLNTNPQAGIEAFLRAQQLVQQRQAQIAQEKNERDRTAIAAQAQAAQAAIQQRSLGLKEQEHKSSIEVEANRLRLKQQQGEAEENLAKTALASKIAEMQSQPEAIQFDGLPPGVKYRGRFQFPPSSALGASPGDLSNLGQLRPVIGSEGEAMGNVVVTGPRTGRFVSNEKKPTIEDRAKLGEEGRLRRLSDSVLVGDRKAIMNQLAKDDAEQVFKMEPEQRKALEGKKAELDAALKERTTPPKKEDKAPEKSPKQVIAEERAKLANQLEKENPDWTPGQVYSEVIKQIP